MVKTFGKRKQESILLAFLCLVALPAPEATARTPRSNCTIFVRTLDHRGTFKKQVLFTRMDSKQECRALAGLHQPIFSPARVRKKRVTFRYGRVPARPNFPSWRGRAVSSRQSRLNRPPGRR